MREYRSRRPIAFWLIALAIPIDFIVSEAFGQNSYDFPQFWRETGVFYTQPIRWQPVDWLKLGAFGAISALSSFADQPVRTIVMSDSLRLFYSPSIVVGRAYGELYSPMILFAGFAGYSLLTGDQKSRKIAYEVGQASLYAGAVVYALKILIGRSRPLTGEGPGKFRPSVSFVDDSVHSFPSGHTAVAFVLSTVLARNVQPVWGKILCYVPALLTPISRMYQDWHWMSDVVFGAAIGYAFGSWVADMHERNAVTASNRSATSIAAFFPLSVSIVLN